VQHSFDGQRLLCKIQGADLNNPNTAACDVAIALKPMNPTAYYVKGLAELATHKLDQAEKSAAKAVALYGGAGGTDEKNLLGLIYYMQERYSLVPGLGSDDPQHGLH